jgi:hypothetical protein
VLQISHTICSSTGWPESRREEMNDCAASQNGPSIDINMDVAFFTRRIRKAGSSIVSVGSSPSARLKARKRSVSLGLPATTQRFLAPRNERTSSSQCSSPTGTLSSLHGDWVVLMPRSCTRNRNGEIWSQTCIMQDNCQSNCLHDMCN